jgi:hypothetical protein
MLAVRLKPFGEVGRPNFILNSLTRLPYAMVETVFLSNPENDMLFLMMDSGKSEKHAENRKYLSQWTIVLLIIDNSPINIYIP